MHINKHFCKYAKIGPKASFHLLTNLEHCLKNVLVTTSIKHRVTLAEQAMIDQSDKQLQNNFTGADISKNNCE